MLWGYLVLLPVAICQSAGRCPLGAQEYEWLYTLQIIFLSFLPNQGILNFLKNIIIFIPTSLPTEALPLKVLMSYS